jgi:hypothetical protein
MNRQDDRPVAAGQAPSLWDIRHLQADDGRPLDAAGGILAGIGLSLPAWIIAVAVLQGLP